MQQLRFREDLNTPDAEFFIRLASLGAHFVFVPEYLMEYRVHLGAVTVGGLWSEQLVECLTPMAVRPEVERYKRQFLSPMVVNAVSRCLQQGDMERAKKFLRNKYYPRRRQANGASVYSAALDAGIMDLGKRSARFCRIFAPTFRRQSARPFIVRSEKWAVPVSPANMFTSRCRCLQNESFLSRAQAAE